MDGEADHNSRTAKHLFEQQTTIVGQQTTIYGIEKVVEPKNNLIKAAIEIDGLSASCNINELPDDLIVNILLRLPLKDAVRTSVLSMRWKFIWTKLPHLIFANDSKDKATERKLMEVNQVLLLHGGPIIKFLLCLADNKNSSEVEQLILRVSNSDLNQFFLFFQKGEPYTMPSSLFSCPKLEFLCLSLCVFRPPKGFTGFSKLVYLGLHRVSTTGTILSKLISSCPLLEKFIFMSSSCVDHIEMIAPNLKDVGFECGLRSLCFKNTPKLLSAVILLHPEAIAKVGPGPPTLSGRLPAIEFLEMSLYYTTFMAFGKDASATDLLLANISNLKSLSLYEIMFDIEKTVRATLMLIGHCPNLEKLKILFCEFHQGDGDIPLHEEQLSKLVSLNHLRDVELWSLLGIPSEFNLIKFLLANAPVLETLSIDESTFMATQDTGTQFLLLLKQCPRASPRAKLSCNGVQI